MGVSVVSLGKVSLRQRRDQTETPLMRSSLWWHNAQQPVGSMIEPRMATERVVILKVDYMWFRHLV